MSALPSSPPIDLVSINSAAGKTNMLDDQTVLNPSITHGPYLSLLDFLGTYTPIGDYNISYNQRTSGNQPDDGCAWTVDYWNAGPNGPGYYVTVAIYGNGARIGHSPFPVYDVYGNLTGYSWGAYQSVAQMYLGNPNTSAHTVYSNGAGGNFPQYGPGSNWSYFGFPYASIDPGTRTIVIYGNYGSGGPGDAGYAYATALVRANWSAMSDQVVTGYDVYGNPIYGATNHITVSY